MVKNFVYFVLFVLAVIAAAELIGIQSFTIGSMTISMLPLVFAIAIAMILALPFLRKGILKKIYSKKNVDFANLGTVLFGLPIAILIGLRREAIGATLGLGREGELAYISEKYTLESPEGRGVISLYVIGTLFGTMFFSIFAPILLDFGIRVEALAMASGVGSGSMMSAASATLVARVPEMENTILAYASASQLLTSFIGTFTMVFLAAPLQQVVYKFLVRGDKK